MRIDREYWRGAPVRASAALASGALTIYLLCSAAPQPVAEDPLRTATSAGARWHAHRTAESGKAYADALALAGLYEELLSEMREGPLLSDAPASAALFRAEALIRLRRFDEALALLDEDVPHSALYRARTVYAMTGDAERVAGDVAKALRMGSGAAWLFRARLALDRNDLASAEAAARRARDSGAAGAAVEAVFVESDIRRGALAEAAARLSKNVPVSSPVENVLDPAAERLWAMVESRSGDAPAAARRFDASLARLGPNSRDLLLTALLKWRAGDLAQALSIVETYRDAAPDEWAGIDIEAGLLLALGRTEDADVRLDLLSEQAPALAALRKSRLKIVQGELDAAYAALADGASIATPIGAAAALLGSGAQAPAEIAGPSESERSLLALAAALQESDKERTRRLAEAQSQNETAGPVALTFAGVALARAGAAAEAARAFDRAIAAAPDFFEPVARRAALDAAHGETGPASARLRSFHAANRTHYGARAALADMLMKAGKEEEALRLLLGAAPADLFADAATALSAVRLARQSNSDELPTLLAAARTAGAEPSLLARLHEAAGDAAGAAAAWRDVLAEAPADGLAPGRYLRAMTASGRRDQGLRLLQAIARREPQSPAAVFIAEEWRRAPVSGPS